MRRLLRSLALLAVLPLAAGCDSGDGMDDPPGGPGSGQYTASFAYAADGSQDDGLPPEGTGAFTFRTDDVLSTAGHNGSGTGRLTLGTRNASFPSTSVSITPAGSGFTVSITSGVNLSVTGTGQLSADGRTLTVSPARVVASAFVGLETGTNTSLSFAFRSDF